DLGSAQRHGRAGRLLLPRLHGPRRGPFREAGLRRPGAVGPSVLRLRRPAAGGGLRMGLHRPREKSRPLMRKGGTIMRIAVAEIAQETDSFTPAKADLKDFEANGLYFGREILERMVGVGPVGGFLEVAAEQKTSVEVLPIVRAWGGAGGTIHEETLASL